ncbi:MAG: cytochrome c-type biogenesis protein [Pseudomonadota bacterium]
MRGLAVFLLLWPMAVFAVEPGEVLSDPALETRARDLSQGLRCPVCQNESIDESSAPVARDLRLLVRERLLAGDSDAEVMEFVVDRYGEFVLLRPEINGANLLLWLAGPAVLILVLGGIALRLRGTAAVETPLTAEEEERLSTLLADTQRHPDRPT